MKTAIYIEDGVVQLVLTPESEFEKAAIASFSKKPVEAQVFSGSFYDCRGGWVRQAEWRPVYYSDADNNDKSVILRICAQSPAVPEAPQ